MVQFCAHFRIIRAVYPCKDSSSGFLTFNKSGDRPTHILHFTEHRTCYTPGYVLQQSTTPGRCGHEFQDRSFIWRDGGANACVHDAFNTLTLTHSLGLFLRGVNPFQLGKDGRDDCIGDGVRQLLVVHIVLEDIDQAGRQSLYLCLAKYA